VSHCYSVLFQSLCVYSSFRLRQTGWCCVKCLSVLHAKSLIKVLTECGGVDTGLLNEQELWLNFKSKKYVFACFYKAYSHLRMQKLGSEVSGSVWCRHVHCTTRLLGSVAKTLLVLYVNKNGHNDESLLCLINYINEERTICR
jgi:hypothetical protein